MEYPFPCNGWMLPNNIDVERGLWFPRPARCGSCCRGVTGGMGGLLLTLSQNHEHLHGFRASLFAAFQEPFDFRGLRPRIDRVAGADHHKSLRILRGWLCGCHSRLRTANSTFAFQALDDSFRSLQGHWLTNIDAQRRSRFGGFGGLEQ